MTKLYLVRHGKARAGWNENLDPGLDDQGGRQAAEVAQALAPLGPLDLLSSPLARARETCQLLAEIWEVTPRIEERVGEIPSPTEVLEERGRWLVELMGKKWQDLGPELQSWRQGIIQALCELDADAVVFTHFIAINVVVGEARGDSRVVCFLPANGSITMVEANGGELSLVELGIEAHTRVR